MDLNTFDLFDDKSVEIKKENDTSPINSDKKEEDNKIESTSLINDVKELENAKSDIIEIASDQIKEDAIIKINADDITESIESNDKSTACNYISCGADSIISIFGRSYEDCEQYGLTPEVTCEYLNNTTNKFLYSYGSGLNYKTKKISKKYSESFKKVIDNMRGPVTYNKSKIYIDSGGFQIANGAINTCDMPKFIDMYYSDIMKNIDSIDHAFILDIPPGPNSAEIFTSYDQIEELNRLSYQKCKEIIPADIIRDKMIYVHHFRTPNLMRIWNKLLWEERMAEGYNYFAVGGIVANLSTSHAIPVSMISMPLVNIIRYIKSRNMKSFKFHILGGAQFTEVFLYKLFEKHIKEVHDIDIDITYDSSMIFKGLSMGRMCYLFDHNEDLRKTQIKSNLLHLKFDDRLLEQAVMDRLNDIADISGCSKLNLTDHPIYDPETNTFTKIVQMYLFMHCFDLYKTVEKKCIDHIDNIYDLYRNDDIVEFKEECLNMLSHLTDGKRTKKQSIKANSIKTTLDLLTSLDNEWSEYLINKHTIYDDINNFDTGILKF